ncbi:MAG: hypothetical protein WBD99_10560 [Thermodesulfobacteriota bacterium]
MNKNAITEICEASDRLLKELNLEKYNNLSGLKSASNQEGIFRKYPDFRDPGPFLTIKAIQPHDGTEEIGLRLILSFLARTFLEGRSAKLRDQILSAEFRALITYGKRSIHYRSVVDEIKNEPKKSIREELDRKRREVVLSVNQLYLKLFEAFNRDSEELGFPTYMKLCDDTDCLGLSRLREKAKVFLSDTDYIYSDLLKWFLLKRMELKLEDLTLNDLRYLFSSFELRGNFPQSPLLLIANRLFSEMGIEITNNLEIDPEKRAGKISGSFCIPLGVPNKILCSINPSAGVENYESFLQTLGKAMCYTHTEAGGPFESRMLRDPTYLEIFSHLFKNLVYQPKWIKRYLTHDIGSDFLEFLYLRQLNILRYYCGKLIYQLLIHENSEYKDRSEHYSQTLKEATLADHDKADYLIDVEPFFYSAVYLNASFIEVGFRSFLREAFDEEWWRKKEAGHFLINLWKHGGRMTSKDIAEKSGIKEIDSTPLVINFQDIFRL